MRYFYALLPVPPLLFQRLGRAAPPDVLHIGLEMQYFDVDLHNNASANLNLDAYSANVKLSDHAKAELSGTATEFGLTANINTTVVENDFKAEYITDNKINAVTVAKADDLTILE